MSRYSSDKQSLFTLLLLIYLAQGHKKTLPKQRSVFSG